MIFYCSTVASSPSSSPSVAVLLKHSVRRTRSLCHSSSWLLPWGFRRCVAGRRPSPLAVGWPHTCGSLDNGDAARHKTGATACDGARCRSPRVTSRGRGGGSGTWSPTCRTRSTPGSASIAGSGGPRSVPPWLAGRRRCPWRRAVSVVLLLTVCRPPKTTAVALGRRPFLVPHSAAFSMSPSDASSGTISQPANPYKKFLQYNPLFASAKDRL